MKYRIILPVLALAIILASSCSKDGRPRNLETLLPASPNVEHLASFPFGADTLLPASADGSTLAAPVQIVLADHLPVDSADTVIDYLDYNVVGVASASYQANGSPISVEIARFAQPIDAYGWYSVHRPNSFPTTDTLGKQSFRLGPVRYIYEGDYAVTLSAPDTSAASLAAIDQLARQVVDKISLEINIAPYHILFPTRDRVPGSDRFFGFHFLGITHLNDVYTMDFSSGTDTSRWFLTPDSTGAKFWLFKDWIARGADKQDMPPIFTFAKDSSIYVEHPVYGRVIAGFAKGKLVGVLGYQPAKFERRATNWVSGLLK